MRDNARLPPSILRILIAAIFIAAITAASSRGQSNPGSLDLSALDSILQSAVEHDEIPGAVLLVEHHGKVVYEKAAGMRALMPAREAMTTDTIFDIASLTKVVATAPSVMKLVEEGKLRLDDPVSRYLPDFTSNGKDQITIRMLLTHTGGLAPDPPLDWAHVGKLALFAEINQEELDAPPGMRFIYSDTGFIVLGELVEKISGIRLDEYARRNVFEPLRMQETRFLPPAEWLPRIAPTEDVGSGAYVLLRGTVHDPSASFLGGVAGNAGVFSTASDLEKFCAMVLSGGRVPGADGERILSEASIKKMTSPQSPAWIPAVRGLGWDIDSQYSSPRGEFFPIGSFGHTGFTGTSIWIDPASETFVILLANSVHPYRRPPISSLRSKVASAVAAALHIGGTQGESSKFERSTHAARPYDLAGIFAESDHTRTGIDVLEDEHFAPLRGKRIGVITNQTGSDAAGRRTIDILARAEGVQLAAIFSPEHGLTGKADERVASATDAATGLPVFSLYGETRRPTDDMLKGLDALVFDIQDAGVRFYTYITTMAYAMEETAKRHIAFFVLDRPDPLDGVTIEGPVLDGDKLSFTGYFPMPVRYGMTPGELAQMFNAENKIGADLHVIAMKDWHRADRFEATGLAWIPPSPNLRSLNAALLYPGIEILQAGGISVGRGTDAPFEVFGAPWIEPVALADALNRRFIPGVRFVPTRFTPTSGIYAGQLCGGMSLVITDRASLNSMLMGLEIAAMLHKTYAASFQLEKIDELLGSSATIERLKRGDAPSKIVLDGAPELDAFRKMREKYLLYP
ncbi:MAG: exo-beta-N-acetylmuramidase NamZ domain-containing protein [Candidatus Acidiferrales bacterium]